MTYPADLIARFLDARQKRAALAGVVLSPTPPCDALALVRSRDRSALGENEPTIVWDLEPMFDAIGADKDLSMNLAFWAYGEHQDDEYEYSRGLLEICAEIEDSPHTCAATGLMRNMPVGAKVTDVTPLVKEAITAILMGDEMPPGWRLV